jgi:hypothetical protein
MNEESIKKAATVAVEHAERQYGRGWEYISHDARVGAAVPFAVQAFQQFNPTAPASDVAAVVRAIVVMVREDFE